MEQPAAAEVAAEAPAPEQEAEDAALAPEEEVAEREGSGAALADAVAEAAEIASGEIASGEIASPREMQAEVQAEMPSGEMTTETA